MLYYTEVCLSPYEVPEHSSICIYISGCINRCNECHYPMLQQTDYGDALNSNFKNIIKLYRAYATCVCFLGEGQNTAEEHKEFQSMVAFSRQQGLRTCLYSGRDIQIEPWMEMFDYIKLGSYKAELGGLNEPTTNQKLYQKTSEEYVDITYNFWRKEQKMLKPAKVKFVGNGSNYKLGCKDSCFTYCRDCDKKDCKMETQNRFILGTIYNAYFLEYWQGKRDSLHVKGEDGVIDYFIPLSDFEIISDDDNVLNGYEAIVKCVVHDYDNDLFELNYGKEYKAIGVDSKGLYLVLDESYDCYFYPSAAFEIISDEYNILNKEKYHPIYDWSLFSE